MASRSFEPVTMDKLRTGLRAYYEAAVKDGVPVPVSRAHDADVGLLINAEVLLDATAGLRFTPEVHSGGTQISVWLPELEIYGVGDTAHAAEEDLFDEVRIYVDEYFAEGYLHVPGRREHYSYVLRALAADLLGQLREVVFAEVEAAV